MIAAAIGVKGEETGIEDGEKASDTSSSLTPLRPLRGLQETRVATREDPFCEPRRPILSE